MDSGKNSMNIDKSLCLYCDKAFLNITDQENHVEQQHKTILKISKGRGSRKSERITKNSSAEPFQGCFYCNNRKLITRCDDLEALFQHLVTTHTDVYYVCKCRMRMQNKTALLNHKKSCKIGGEVQLENEDLVKNTNIKRRTKKVQAKNEEQCDSLSESEDNSSHYQTRTNAINKKSENCQNSNSIVNRGNNNVARKKNTKLPSSSSSTISSCSSSKASDEYTIPLTRQKLKDPVVNSITHKNRTTSNKKSSKALSTPSNILAPYIDNSAPFSSSASSTSSTSKTLRAKSSKIVNNPLIPIGNAEIVENSLLPSITSNKTEVLSNEFDEDFYKKISYNIRANLNCFIDGKADRLCNNKFNLDGNLNQKQSDSYHPSHDNEIHEATNFEDSTPPFPALLTAEQYGYGDSTPNKSKRQFTKNSWKWRWDLIKKYKYVNEGGKIVKKVKQITTGLKDLSQLDMWTQLSMRSRYENLNGQCVFDDDLNEKLSRRLIKTQHLEQLNGILDNRLTPEIHIEQLQQMLVKEELVESESVIEEFNENEISSDQQEVLSSLQLARTDFNSSFSTASLSGEWARPRCFICIDCGQEFDLMKTLNDHKNSEHPYVVSAHYEVVGRENLEQKLYKNLFIPKKALNTIGYSKSISISNDSKSNDASSSSQESSTITDQREKECTKCRKVIKYSNDIDIYRHILDCIEDKVWMQAKKRNKYRRSRRKPKKNIKKAPCRAVVDQKKNISSPINKEIAEGEISSLSISEPPTPNEDIKQKISNVSSAPTIKSKSSSTINENFISNDERGNIKSFFRVSKTTPNLPQKMVVQMLQMPNTHNNNHGNNSMKHSLRSSVKKQTDKTNNNAPENESTKESLTESIKMQQPEANMKCDAESSIDNNDNISTTVDQKFDKTSTPIQSLSSLHILTPEKDKSALISPSNSTNSSLVSPTSCSSVPKKKKKLNDCIAMLTCKIQEKLGVNFFENAPTKIFPNEPSPQTPISQPQDSTQAPSSTTANSLLSIQAQSLSLVNYAASLQVNEIENVKNVEYSNPIQDSVIDLSVKKEVKREDSMTEINPTSDDNIQKTAEQPADKETSSPTVSLKEPVESETTFVIESFKISIARERIPDLQDIIENQSINTVKKLTISESERKAFEEQKNRILQILGKKTTAKSCKMQSAPKKTTLRNLHSKKVLSKNNTALAKTNQIPVTNKNDTNVEKPIELKGVPKPKENYSENNNVCIDEKVNKPANGSKKVPKAKNSSQAMQQSKRIEKNPKKSKNNNKKPTEKLPKEISIDTTDQNDKSHLDTKNSLASATTPLVALPQDENASVGSHIDQNDDSIRKKFEQAMKTTNRIRCRRLSVVVDPIINLSNFQKNRKIRLTNNSQQNGFYDLLTNDQIFNAIKSTPQLKREIRKLEVKKTAIIETVKEVKSTILNKTNTRKTKKKLSKYATGKVMKVTKKKKKKPILKLDSPGGELTLIEEKVEKGKNLEKNDVVILTTCSDNNFNESHAIGTSKIRSKKNLSIQQDANNQSSDLKTSQNETNLTDSSGKLKIKVDNSIQPTIDSNKEPKPPFHINESTKINLNQRIEKDLKTSEKNHCVKQPRKRMPRNGNKVKKQNLVISKSNTNIRENFSANDEKLDVSLSSDTSNENDIPLAKLMSSVLSEKGEIKEKNRQSPSKVITKIPLKKCINQNITSPTQTNKKSLPTRKIETNHQITEEELSNGTKTITGKGEDKSETKKLELVKAKVKNYIDQIDTSSECSINETAPLKCETPNCKEIPVKNVPNSEIAPMQQDQNYEVFSLNEDSFFNDDNDIDQANDRINALVNNIINSSELVDSESEKAENLKQKEASCTVCSKMFRNVKVLEKHKKTTTHLMKAKKREKHAAIKDEASNSKHIQLSCNDESKIFRTKGSLKTFDNVLSTSVVPSENELKETNYDEFKPIVEDSTSFIPLKVNDNLEEDEEELSTKDKIFDSLFSNIENKLQAASKNEPLPKFDFPTLSHHDSESSSESWDLKHDADIDWDVENTGILEGGNSSNNHVAMLGKNLVKYPATTSNDFAKGKLSKSKETVVPTKSLIMGKIFKKHRDREKQKTPQADAPNNKPDIKNSLDEIFDHLKNSADIDDKVLTCPSPKTILKNSGGKFLPHSSHSSDMLETAAQPNNKNPASIERSVEKEIEKNKSTNKSELKIEEDGIGKRKSRRRCAIQMKTFAETWSSDEYEELHDTNDIMSIINEIEKRDSSKKRKEVNDSEVVSITKSNDCNTKKKILFQDSFVDKKSLSLKNRKLSICKDSGHKSDDELKTTPRKSQMMALKKRRMSCFVPSTTKVPVESYRKKPEVDLKLCVENDVKSLTPKCSGSNLPPTVAKAKSTNCKNNTHAIKTSTISQNAKKKSQKHRKRPRNKVKNMAYDSDSDFELNFSKKSKTTSLNHHSESESNSDNDDEISITDTVESATITKEQTKLLPNDLNVVKSETTSANKAAIPLHKAQPFQKPSQQKSNEVTLQYGNHTQDSTNNRTKRHSSEKLYYWSSSSDSDDIEQGDMPEGENAASSMISQQPEQHGWIVGDSHKKLVTLLAHAKIKNKIN